MQARAEKPRSMPRWVQSVGAAVLLAVLLAAVMIENYSYRLLWGALPAGFGLAWAWTARQRESKKASRLAIVVAAMALSPVFGWPIWVAANLANQFGLREPVQRLATVTAHDESFVRSGRGGRRYALALRLDETGRALEFLVERAAEAYGQRYPVCEWKGLLGVEAYTLGSC
jgi:hypothetical protein